MTDHNLQITHQNTFEMVNVCDFSEQMHSIDGSNSNVMDLCDDLSRSTVFTLFSPMTLLFISLPFKTITREMNRYGLWLNRKVKTKICITVNSLLKFVLFMEIDRTMVKLTVLCLVFVCVCVMGVRKCIYSL